MNPRFRMPLDLGDRALAEVTSLCTLLVCLMHAQNAPVDAWEIVAMRLLFSVCVFLRIAWAPGQ